MLFHPYRQKHIVPLEDYINEPELCTPHQSQIFLHQKPSTKVDSQEEELGTAEQKHIQHHKRQPHS